jgi:hypothetical protein
VVDKSTALKGKAHRPGVYQCNACREQFSVTVGTVFERSKISLTKWLAALFLMVSSKKGVSAHQVHRMLGISYKSTWFMMHRLREAMRSGALAPMGGEGQIVEIDETYISKKEGEIKRRGGLRHKRVVISLVERGDSVRSFHVESTKKEEIFPILRTNIARETHVMTDDAYLYRNLTATSIAERSTFTVTSPNLISDSPIVPRSVAKMRSALIGSCLASSESVLRIGELVKPRKPKR